MAAWTAAWFLAREGMRHAIEAGLAREAVAGRRWECPDRSIVGYPFRLEVVCPGLAVRRGSWTATLGPVTVTAQVYDPRHVTAEIGGPFRASDGRIAVDGSWQDLRVSIRIRGDGFQRASIVVDAPRMTIAGLPPGDVAFTSGSLEADLRPHPTRWEGEGAIELSARSSKAVLPMLNEIVGGVEPADIHLQLSATQARGARLRSLANELERWRQDGGKLELSVFSVAKGPRRVEASGEAMLDELHRPAGRFEIAAAGADGVLGALAGGRAGGAAGAVLGSVLGSRPPRQEPPQGTDPALKRLPPLRLDKGRVYFGPIAIPGLRLPPLY
jgi:hypothetical protein